MIRLRPRMCMFVVMACVGCGGGEDSAKKEPGGSTDFPTSRRVTRMSADQFNRSLTIATGQQWSGYGAYAATLGKPDFNQTTKEGKHLSVAFEKLVSDAARETCHGAVEADRANTAPERRVILRHVELTDTAPEKLAKNVRYLLLRFHGTHVTKDSDKRVLPWLKILQSPVKDDSGADVDMAERWKAVCVGLVTHSDFVTY